MGFQCVVCHINFSSISNLRKHVRKFHPEDVSKVVPLKYKRSLSEGSDFQCKICNKTFIHKKTLQRHVKVHGDAGISIDGTSSRRTKTNEANSSKYSKKCPLCPYYGLNRKDLLQHFKHFHQIELALKNLTFVSIEDFNQWKGKQLHNSYY